MLNSSERKRLEEFQRIKQKLGRQNINLKIYRRKLKDIDIGFKQFHQKIRARVNYLLKKSQKSVVTKLPPTNL